MDLVSILVARLLVLEWTRLLVELVGLGQVLVALGLVELGRLERLVGLVWLEPLVAVGLVPFLLQHRATQEQMVLVVAAVVLLTKILATIPSLEAETVVEALLLLNISISNCN